MNNIAITEKSEVSYLNHLLADIQNGLSKQSSTYPLGSEIATHLQNIRDHALTWIKELEIPTQQDEEWRFTNLSPLLEHRFQVADFVTLQPEAIASLIIPEAEHRRIVFVNGIYAPHLSNLEEIPEGVFIGNLAQLPEQLRDRLPNYLSQNPGNQDVFATLNTTGLNDVAVLWVEKNKIIENPIHLLFIALPDNRPVINQPRGLIVAEAGSSSTVIEHYATAEVFGCSDRAKVQPYFTNAVTEIFLEENAEVNHTRLQRGAGTAFHIGKNVVFQCRNSRYTCHAVSLGAKLSRHNLDIYQRGEGTETTLNGLTLIGSEQLADTHSAMMFNHQHGTFNQVHKCIIDHKAHGVFNGKVFVPQTAQFTNANQLSRNLLLSSKGRIDTKPQLEIVADNVKCSHGATVSQLEEDEVFYLRSRGLSEQMSRHLLIDAFAAEILGKLPSETLQQVLSRCVSCRTEFS
ncbi:Fe-S cluster assembly protein SufD [Planktothrix sp. FACHB-1365]|uniref:Fe-S cluster assembly protein SufD n=1 Tax=Planktothrix sp. FACHB-1365 TaxID=2692855 RepID=UPI00168319F7|nr:Fe-S cluster assembly protein SufD [Planktothrix sp. FACHB-1365]MBD2482181.1 Fe-S cluster assembly protein SufD [Planktothrix sp. FACHB-1365]